MLRKLHKGSKYSFVVSIPRELLKKLRWKSGQFLHVEQKGKKIEIKDATEKEI